LPRKAGTLTPEEGEPMKKIQILGPGCPNCRRLAEMTERVAGELGLDYELEKVTDILEITRFGVMATPGLAVDGKVLVSGRVPTEAEIREMLG
jgi:small redox-active disulfide protein 2